MADSIEKLKEEVQILRREKKGRLYYQNIIYHVCLVLDRYKNKRISCGTAETPTTEVEDTINELWAEFQILRGMKNG